MDQTVLLKAADDISVSFRNVSGNQQVALGQYLVKFMIKGIEIRHPFFVIKDFDENCILGIGFITSNEIVVDPKFRTAHFAHNGVQKQVKLAIASVEQTAKLSFVLSGLTDDEKEQLNQLLQTHYKVFALTMSDLRVAKGFMHEINTTVPPVLQGVSRVQHVLRPAIKTLIDDMMAHGFIRESSSPYASPIVVVPIKNGEVRLCIDYRTLNGIKISKDRFPLLRRDDTIDALSGANYFSSLDLFSGYHQILVKPEDQHKTAFICEFGLYE